MPIFPEEMCATERVAFIVWLLMRGWRPTTRELAERCGISWEGARLLMQKVGRVLDVRQDSDGRWKLEGKRKDREIEQ